MRDRTSPAMRSNRITTLRSTWTRGQRRFSGGVGMGRVGGACGDENESAGQAPSYTASAAGAPCFRAIVPHMSPITPRSTPVTLVDAFTRTPGKGNRAGVVLDAARFDVADMLAIA